jgi:3',5'-cyclic AMP phosphodiesterase CpdA
MKIAPQQSTRERRSPPGWPARACGFRRGGARGLAARIGTAFALAFAACGFAAPAWDQPAPALARIALVADTHTNRAADADQGRYRGRFDQVIAAVNAARVDVVLIAGDLTQDGKPEQMADFKEQIKGFEAPVLCVPGNHDIGNKRIAGKQEGPPVARVELYERTLGPSFFVREISGVRVVGVNAPILGSGLPREAEMWTWLERELARPANRPRIVLLHYPLFLNSPTEAGGGYHNVEPEPRARLLQLIRQGGVRVVLSGHLHHPLTIRRDGVLFVTTPSVSFGLPAGKQPEGWTLVTLSPPGDAEIDFRTIK